MQALLAWSHLFLQAEPIRQALSIPRPIWNEIGIVASNAPDNDNHIRMWYSHKTPDTGLMFACQAGVVNAKDPLGEERVNHFA